MAIINAEAIVLKSHPLSESDLIVTLFTKEVGKVRVVAKAARRLRGKFGGALEPLSHVRVDFYEREHRELAYLSRCELEETFFDLQADYAFQVSCAYWIEVLDLFCQDREANPKVFRLILALLNSRKRGVPSSKLMPYFNFWILRLAGFLPGLETCCQCGSPLEKQNGGRFFQPEKRVYCMNCRARGGLRLWGEEIMLAKLFLVQPITRIDGQRRFKEQSFDSLNSILEPLILQVVERPIRSLGLLRELRSTAGVEHEP